MKTIDLNNYLGRDRLSSLAPRVTIADVRLETGAPVPFARAVVNVETGEPISIVGKDYHLVPHGHILELAESAIQKIAARDSDVPRGIFFTRRGAKMRALFRFARFRRAVTADDELVPVIRIQNSYDRTSRITIEIGAFRYACTNFAIGGGIFAGGFSTIHQGEINVLKVQEQLENFLDQFEEIIETFKRWLETPWTPGDAQSLSEHLAPFGPRHRNRIAALVEPASALNRFRAYNDFTFHATHEMRTANAAFRFLEATNEGFQDLDRESRLPNVVGPVWE